MNKNDIRRSLKRMIAIVLNKTGAVERRLNKGGVIILMLHKVNNKEDPLSLTISPQILDRILLELNKRCEIVSLESLFDKQNNLIVSGKAKVVITFDDGYRDNYEQAFPILKKHSAPATIYLSIGHMDGKYFFWYEKLTSGIKETELDRVDLTDIGSEIFNLKTQKNRKEAIETLNHWLKIFTNKVRQEKIGIILSRLKVKGTNEKASPMLSLSMVKEMLANGISFGSHTLSHPILSRESKESIEREVIGSKQLLKGILNKEIKGFAYPNGTEDDINDTVVKTVELAGYQHACTTISGINYERQDPYLLKRINVDLGMCSDDHGDFLPDLFWAKVTSLI